MKRLDSSIRPPAQWPPPASQVASAIFVAVMRGQVTSEEIGAVDGLPPSKFPPELMVKLGFSPPCEQAADFESPSMPAEEASESAWAELKAQGYPKEDRDPATGEKFQVFPEGVFSPDHPLVNELPMDARPENWREMDSAHFNPNKAKSIGSGSPPVSSAWPPDDKRVERAVAAAIRCGAVGDKELLLMQSRPKSQWPASLWGALGFVVSARTLVDALVEVTASGTVYYVAYD